MFVTQINEKYIFSSPRKAEDFLNCLAGNSVPEEEAIPGGDDASVSEDEAPENISEDENSGDAHTSSEVDLEEVAQEEIEPTRQKQQPDILVPQKGEASSDDDEDYELVQENQKAILDEDAAESSEDENLAEFDEIVEEIIGNDLIRRSPNNPFVTRHITIHFAREDLDIHTKKLVVMFGHHVWHLTCEIGVNSKLEDNDDDDRDEEAPLRNLDWILGRMPNLKILDVLAEGWLCWQEIQFFSIFPQLKNLSSLRLENGFGMKSLPEKLLDQYGHQITCLYCGENVLNLELLSADRLKNWLPNIRQLTTEYNGFSELKKVSNVGWRLKRLTWKWGDLYTEAHEFFKTMECFANSLEELELDGFMGLRKFEIEDAKKLEIKPISKLKIIRFRVTFKGKLADWFWFFVRNMCKQVEQLHFNSLIQEIPNQKKISAKAFRLLPKLQLVVFWEKTESEKLTELTKTKFSR